MFELIVGILLLSIFCVPAKAQNYEHNAAGKYYNVNGIKLYCEVYGSGPPLLLLHGNGGDLSAFKDNIPYFSKKYTVIAVDSRAQGRSVDTSNKLTFEMMADDFSVLLTEMHIHAAYVIGWSDGGICALLMAIRHPDKVIKLAATGANVTPDESAFAPGEWLSSKKVYEENKDRKFTSAKEKNDWKLFMLDWQQPHITAAQLQSIKAPSLIICGDHDVISTSHTKMIQQYVPHSLLWIVPNSGHATLMEHADAFNEKVDAFFTSHIN